jgi:putrescine transport system substrate-binding protein
LRSRGVAARLVATLRGAALVAALLALAGCSKPAPPERVVSVLNWADFIGKHTVADFERDSGIKVDYDIMDSDQALEAKILAGGSGYDVVETSTLMFSRQIKAGAYRKLDKSLLPNLKNLDPEILALYARFDPGNEHAVPYLHSLNGFAYNVDKIRERMPNAPVDSLDMLFKPEVVQRFADCGVTFLDSSRDALQLAFVYLHLDPNTTRKEDFKAAEDLLMKVRPYIKNFDSSEYLNALASGEYCISMSWSSDYAISMARAKAAGLDVHLAFTVPKEGTNVDYSAFLIPADSVHVAEAYEFLNYILRPDVIAAITNDTHYGNDNIAANPLVDAAIRNDPTLYPTPEVRRRMFLSDEVSQATERVVTRTWTRIKTAH